MAASNHYVYIVECIDGTLYTGYTIDIDRRLEEHNSGTGAKYTRGRYPVKLKYQESFGSRSQAQKREYQIKQLPRKKKEELID
jgi:putative endonuclease